MAAPSIFLGELTREQVREVAAHAVALLPVAAVEQHGPHLPIITDALLTEHIAAEAARRANESGARVLVAPLLPYGLSAHHRPFPGVLSLRLPTMLQILADVGESLILSGFRKLFILNGHGGNSDAIGAAASELAAAHPAAVMAASYWTIAKEALAQDEETQQLPWIPGHAGAFETACVLALRPDLVDRDQLPGESAARSPRDGAVGSVPVHRHRWIHQIDGYTDVPALATAAAGQRALAIIAEAVAGALEQFARTSL